MAANKVKIENPALNFITGAEATEPAQAPTEPKKILRPQMKTHRTERYNLLLDLNTKIKLQRMIERDGYKSVNDYINYLVAVAVADEAEPTAEEIQAYNEYKEQRTPGKA